MLAFISHRTQDAPHAAERIAEAIRSVYGPESVFLDHRSLQAGASWPEELEEALDAAQVVVVVIGPEWNEGNRLAEPGDWVRAEIRRALARRIPLIPVLVDGTPFPSDVPPEIGELRTVQWLAFRAGRDSQSDVNSLLQAMSALVPITLTVQYSAGGPWGNSIAVEVDGTEVYRGPARTATAIGPLPVLPGPHRIRATVSSLLLAKSSDHVVHLREPGNHSVAMAFNWLKGGFTFR